MKTNLNLLRLSMLLVFGWVASADGIERRPVNAGEVLVHLERFASLPEDGSEWSVGVFRAMSVMERADHIATLAPADQREWNSMFFDGKPGVDKAAAFVCEGTLAGEIPKVIWIYTSIVVHLTSPVPSSIDGTAPASYFLKVKPEPIANFPFPVYRMPDEGPDYMYPVRIITGFEEGAVRDQVTLSLEECFDIVEKLKGKGFVERIKVGQVRYSKEWQHEAALRDYERATKEKSLSGDKQE